MKNEHEIKPLEGGLGDGVAFRKQLRELKCGIDAAFEPLRRVCLDEMGIAMRGKRHAGIIIIVDECSGSFERKHVESKVIEKPEPKQIEGEK